MSKRYRDTQIWNEDWFIILPMAYKLLWEWINDYCDHAGIWKPNLAVFVKFNGEVDLEKALEFYNDDEKTRLIKLDNGKFFIPGFFVFQYGTEMNLNNKVHYSINQIYILNGVNADLIRGLKALKDMDKEKEKDKDKDKDKKEKVSKKPKEELTQFSPFVAMTNEEYSKLIEEHGLELTNKFIEKLSNYKGSSGKTYKSDYRAILSWVIDGIKKDSGQKGKPSKSESLLEQDKFLRDSHG